VEPQLAVGLAWDKIPRYAHYSMEPKLDGIRCVAYKDSDGRVTLTSRGSKDLTEKLPHIVQWLEDCIEKPWTFLDGELGYRIGDPDLHILDFNATMRVLGSGVEVALDKQRTPIEPIRFHVFDTMSIFPDWERREHLEAIMADSEEYDPVVLVPRMDAFDEEYYTEYVQVGGEGVMLKNPDALYDPGGRHANNWYKVKKFDTIDVFIVGYKEGEGKYKGMLGALNVQIPGKDMSVGCFWVAGMDDDWRKEFYDNFPKYHNKMIEVKHFGLTAGTPRFPQFLRMRPDLD
jgi:ATP-dependent DNA ligase